MESGLFLIGLLIASFAIYQLVSRRLASPQATVRALLRHYHSFERAGFPEQECLFRVLTSRSGWKNLPLAFLAEIVARLRSKENVIRFVSLAEEYRFDRKDLRAIAKKEDMEAAMRDVAHWLGDFGNRLQKENRLKEAEFVQKLALGLQPDQYFTKLPLATTYYRMERYADAVPLFEDGLAHLEKSEGNSPVDDRQPSVNLKELRAGYEEMYAACLKAARSALAVFPESK
jgi:tetratricopeptide (TPR) repeat protein